MFVTVELLYGTWGKRERKKSMTALVILQNITSVKVEDIGYTLKAVEKWGLGGKGVRENNGRG
jgi:hypothetical protein